MTGLLSSKPQTPLVKVFGQRWSEPNRLAEMPIGEQGEKQSRGV